MKRFSFKGGIHPLHNQHEGKSATREVPIRDFVSDTVCIPMNMHIGAPSTVCVKKGDQVKIGQVIGEPVGPLGVPVHASISGKVTEVGPKQQLASTPSMCVTIENDFQDEWVELSGLGSVESVKPELIIPAVKAAGICGMGGACFPTHVKLSIPSGKSIDTIILNGAECETFLTSDYRLMLESPGRIIDGLRAVMRATGVKRGIIGIEDNKLEAVEAMQTAARNREGVEIAVLKTKYPQGGEKQLIQAITGREVPSGGLPMDAHVIVINVGTSAAIADAVVDGKPLISRITTITGAVRKPSNLLLRIGTIVSDAVSAAGGYAEEPGKIFAGGSMTGICLPDDSVSISKATNGIVALTEKQAKLEKETQCIRCGRCVDACPSGLQPFRLMQLIEMGELDLAEKEHVKDCILCGSCSYICPARRLLVPSIKVAKDELARRAKK